jgi:hypothetical protein
MSIRRSARFMSERSGAIAVKPSRWAALHLCLMPSASFNESRPLTADEHSLVWVQVRSLNLHTREAEACRIQNSSKSGVMKTVPSVHIRLEVIGDASQHRYKKLGECNVYLSDVKVFARPARPHSAARTYLVSA